MDEKNITVDGSKLPNVIYVTALILIVWPIGFNNLPFTFFIVFFFSCLIIDLNTKRIIINNDGIHYKSLFRKATIKWDDIKSYGGFIVKYAKGVIRVDKYTLIEKRGLFVKKIFITSIPFESLGIESDPLHWSHRNDKDYIGFVYRKEILEIIDLYIMTKKLRTTYDFDLKKSNVLRSED